MVDYFVGPGGNDLNNGLTWALRKLTLNGAEDVPVVAGDNVYVGPGVYRELLTIDVSGGAGNPITYIGDVTGENTDGVGGAARITGSDDDQTAVRASLIVANNRDSRVFRGFALDTWTTWGINSTSCNDWELYDLVYQNGSNLSVVLINEGLRWVINRNKWIMSRNIGIQMLHAAPTDNVNHLVENGIFIGCGGEAIAIIRGGDIAIRGSSFINSKDDAIDVQISPNAGHPCIVENCILAGSRLRALEGAVVGDLVEDYNTFYGNAVDRLNVAVGANSVTFPPIFNPMILLNGIAYEKPSYTLSQWSEMRTITDSGAGPTDDFHGITRPVTNGKRSWGAIQFVDKERETGTVRTGTASIVLHDAGRHQIFVPITGGLATTFSIWVRREANYAGVLPQIVIKQPGQADRTTTAVGATGVWEELTDTFAPAAAPAPTYVVIELVSNNTAVAGAFDTFFDDLTVVP